MRIEIAMTYICQCRHSLAKCKENSSGLRDLSIYKIIKGSQIEQFPQGPVKFYDDTGVFTYDKEP